MERLHVSHVGRWGPALRRRRSVRPSLWLSSSFSAWRVKPASSNLSCSSSFSWWPRFLASIPLGLIQILNVSAQSNACEGAFDLRPWTGLVHRCPKYLSWIESGSVDSGLLRRDSEELNQEGAAHAA